MSWVSASAKPEEAARSGAIDRSVSVCSTRRLREARLDAIDQSVSGSESRGIDGEETVKASVC